LQDKTEEEAKEFVKNINSELPGLMELEFENYFVRGIFVSSKEGSSGAKKKYAMIDKNNVMKIKGFETIRGNWSPVAKETQEEVLRIILEENDVDKALKYVREVVNDLKEKKISKSKVIIHTQLNKELNEYVTIGPHVAIARLLRARGHDVGAGTRIDYVVMPGKGIIRDRVKIPEDAEDYDSDYYVNNQVIPAVGTIFQVLGFSKEELATGKKQSKLGSFF
jgi:DNA polymerase I